MTELYAPAGQAVADLAARQDIEALLRRFYGRVMVDDVLAEPFAELRIKGLDSHIPVMADFWETASLSRRALSGQRLARPPARP